MYEIWFSRSLGAFVVCTDTCGRSPVRERALNFARVCCASNGSLVQCEWWFFFLFLAFCGRQESMRQRQNNIHSEREKFGARGSENDSYQKVLIVCTYTDSLWFLLWDMKVELFRHFLSNEKLVYFIRVYKNNQLIRRNNTAFIVFIVSYSPNSHCMCVCYTQCVCIERERERERG